jgi:hypothetical protein
MMADRRRVRTIAMSWMIEPFADPRIAAGEKRQRTTARATIEHSQSALAHAPRLRVARRQDAGGSRLPRSILLGAPQLDSLFEDYPGAISGVCVFRPPTVAAQIKDMFDSRESTSQLQRLHPGRYPGLKITFVPWLWHSAEELGGPLYITRRQLCCLTNR